MSLAGPGESDQREVSRMRTMVWGTAVLLCFALAGCGGGGGGSSSNTPPDFSLSTTQLSFSSIQNGPAAQSQTFTVTTTGGTYGVSNDTVYFSAGVSGVAVSSAQLSNCAGTTCQVVVTPAANLAAGS